MLHGISVATTTLKSVRWRVRKLWWWTLRHRSQKARRHCDWLSLNAKPWFQLPYPHVTQAWV